MKILKVIGEVDQDGLILCDCEMSNGDLESIWVVPEMVEEFQKS